MTKELEALNRICEHLDLDDEYFYLKNGEKTDYKIIEKSLKAFEIIKRKGVAVGFIQLLTKENLGGVRKYNDYIGNKKLYLTQEEYELLKDELL